MGPLGGEGSSTAVSLTVLVVDDEPEIADLVTTYLERVDDGLEVTDVTDPRTGLEQIRDGHYDGVVSDYHMPAMDGLTFLERVSDIDPGATRILYTSDDADKVVERARRADVEFVQKRMRRERYARIATYIRRGCEGTGA